MATDAAHTPVDPDHPALAAERCRAAALVARDTATLAGLLHPALRHVHAPGACHDRAALLRFVAEGPRFLVVDFTPQQQWRLADDAVLFCGQLHMRLQRDDAAPQDVQSWVTALWRCSPGDGWRLAVFQSTKQAEA